MCKGADHAAGYSGTVSYPVAQHANLTFRLKNPSGTVVATTSSATGTASLSSTAPAAGLYMLEV